MILDEYMVQYFMGIKISIIYYIMENTITIKTNKFKQIL
jgi:hypothetical protein